MAERIGIVGGGQLARMLTEAAAPLGFEVTVIDPTERCPAAQVGAQQIPAELTDEAAIHELAARSDVVTWEIEHINVDALEAAEVLGADVQPSPRSLRIINDKLSQKHFLRHIGVPTPTFMDVPDEAGLQLASQTLGGMIIKTRRGGYDGRGNTVVGREPDWGEITATFNSQSLYAERLVSFQKELAVIAARDKSGNVVTYPVVETIHKDNICHMVVSPGQLPHEAVSQAVEIANEVVRNLEGAGVFAIEMFLDGNDNVLVNEIAPRVHNSGHQTIEGNITSQFQQHIRAITGLPLGSTRLISPSVMINILGARNGDVQLEGLSDVLGHEGVYVHIYGKRPTKLARKMGHITVCAGSIEEAKQLAAKARKELSI